MRGNLCWPLNGPSFLPSQKDSSAVWLFSVDKVGFRTNSAARMASRHLNLGKVRGVKSKALERRHLAILGRVLIGKRWKRRRAKNFRALEEAMHLPRLGHSNRINNYAPPEKIGNAAAVQRLNWVSSKIR